MEKLLAQLYYKTLPRPNETCKKIPSILSCLGMPSGHTEAITLLTIFAFLSGFINIFWVISLILLVVFERVITQMHTINQVMVGFLLGLLYALIYYSLKSPIYICIIAIMILILYVLLITTYIEKQLYSQIPTWVDNKYFSIIQKKRSVFSLPLKLICNVGIIFVPQTQLFISWSDVEKRLDKIYETIKDKNIDCIIGIKSGGAILSTYLAKKMNKPVYSVKFSQKCYKEKISDSICDMFKRVYGGKLKTFNPCEKINENIENLDILLIDESIVSGSSMKAVMNYLTNEKKVKSIIPCVICDWKKHNLNNIIVPDPITYFVYPWGYDN